MTSATLLGNHTSRMVVTISYQEEGVHLPRLAQPSTLTAWRHVLKITAST